MQLRATYSGNSIVWKGNSSPEPVAHVLIQHLADWDLCGFEASLQTKFQVSKGYTKQSCFKKHKKKIKTKPKTKKTKPNKQRLKITTATNKPNKQIKKLISPIQRFFGPQLLSLFKDSLPYEDWWVRI